jgi:hypothetical protein
MQKDRETSFIKVIHPSYVSASDLEEDNSSGVESFDEDDIYDGSENRDEIIYTFLDLEVYSPLGDMVCPPLHSGVWISHVT